MATTLRKCRFVSASSGADDFVVGSAIVGFVLPAAAGAEDGLHYNYMASFGNQFESGDGLYNAGTLTRDICLSSSNNDTFVNFSSPPIVIMTYATESPLVSGSLIKSTFFSSSTTWNKDPKTKNIIAIAIGSGGGGAGGTDEGGGFTDGGGGGGGGAASISFLNVAIVSGYTITINPGGTAGPSGGNGGIGGDTIIGSNIVVAKGGLGGIGPNGVGGAGGPGPSGVGQILITGGAGQGGYSGSAGGRAGDGGSPAFFAGSVRRNIAATTANGNYGCGGGGGGPGSVPGFAGAPGAVWILEFS